MKNKKTKSAVSSEANPQEIIILPADDPKKLRLGWAIYEVSSEEEYQRILKKDGHLKEYLHRNHPDRLKETNIIDQYRSHHAVIFKPEITQGWTSIEILSEFKGKKLDNSLVNALVPYRPSAVRITNGAVTLDAYTWRVTVLLEDDDETIRHISQEVQIGKHGVGPHKDVSKNKPNPICVINDYAISKIKVK